ncbi:hypothetical protein BDF19DRAFT_412247 [Syncephalis fuscata]|nr:hypothetical protein BDF19DRAFT_412247 [Syncephalis fuscata]
MDSEDLWLSLPESLGDSDNHTCSGPLAGITDTPPIVTSTSHQDETGETCSPMMIDSETTTTVLSSTDGSHSINSDDPIGVVDSNHDDLQLMLAAAAAAAGLTPNSLASLDPTTLAVAGMDDDYWQFIHSDLMSTESMVPNALQLLSEAQSTSNQNDETVTIAIVATYLIQVIIV